MKKKTTGWKSAAVTVLNHAPDEFLRVMRIRIDKELERRLSACEQKYFTHSPIGQRRARR